MLVLLITIYMLPHLIRTAVLLNYWWCPDFTAQLRTLRLSEVRELTEDSPAWSNIDCDPG